MAFTLDAPLGVKPEVLRLCAEQLGKARAALVNKSADEALFSGRRRIKKLRALLQLIRPGLSRASFARFDTRLKETARDISPSRDLAVMRMLLEAPAYPLPVRPSEGLTQAWRKVLDAHEVGRPEQTVTKRMTEQFDRRLTDAEQGLAELDWLDMNEQELIAAGMTRAFSRARKAWRRAMGSREAGDAHALRKHAKPLRFQIRLVGSSWPEHRQVEENALKALGNLLGHDRDLMILTDCLQSGHVAKRWRQERSEVLFAWRRHSTALRDKALLLAAPLLNVSAKYQALKWTQDWPSGDILASTRSELIAVFGPGDTD